MDRRKFIHGATANLGAYALGTMLPCAVLGGARGLRRPSGSFSVRDQSADESVRKIDLVAASAQVEIPTLGIFEKWLYNGTYPGPEIRLQEGVKLRLTVANRLPEGTTVHWHGVPVHNSMDGVPSITQPAIAGGESFDYEFEASPAGTFMYHSHFGLQSERGLVGPLIIEEKTAHIAYDREYTLTLTDFLSGPPTLMSGLRRTGATMAMGTPPYVALLINGRPPEAPAVFNVKSGQRARLRLVNPSGATIYRFAVGGHQLTVANVDGRPVEPLKIDALHIAPGERYDVVVEASNPGVWPIVAQPDNELPPARAVLRYTDSNDSMPRGSALPDELTRGRMLQLSDLHSLE